MVTKANFGATVRPRPQRNGTVSWDVRYRLDGSSKSKSFVSSDAAEKWARVVRQIGPTEAVKLLSSGIKANGPTVDEYAVTFIAAKSGLEPKTADHYRMFMSNHISPAFGDLPLEVVSAELVSKWVNEQAAKGAASKSIQNRHGFLSSLMRSALQDELIRRNPCTKTRIKKTVTPENVFLTPDEFTTLLSYIHPHYQSLVYLLAATGLRWGEAVALTPADINLEARTLHVSKAWKSSKENGWYIGPPKTSRSRRTVSFDDDLAHELVPLMGRTYLFETPSGKPVNHSHFYLEVWNPARRLANGLAAFDKTRGTGDAYRPRTGGIWDRTPAAEPIRKMPRIHDLRHSHASWLLADGNSMFVVQRRLGHESIETTEKTYSHILPEQMNAPAATIGRLLAGAMPQLES
jgi:integrase